MADNDLARFVLENVKELESGEKKGSGAYGAVYRVTVNGVTCIDKRLHDILVNPEVPRRQRESIREKFRIECVILSKLRHPHIVHFVGVRCGRNPSDLSLVMECLHTDLAKFLEDHQEKGVVIPVPIKLSILLDVSYGLLYLHTLTPPIIHRDLSANNILLTADGLQAKIADLGVSKLLDLQTQTQIAQTKVPGSQNYMPPEALAENPEYGLKLDIFSFGHLMLYTATQEFPGVHEVPLTLANLEQGTIQIAKRRKAIDKMGGQQHCLHELVMQCLQDKPEQRPNTLKLNEGLKELCAKNPRCVTEVLQLSGEAEKMTKETDAVWRSMVDDLEAQLERTKQKEESAQKQLEAMTESNKRAYQKCQELEEVNMHLSEQMNELSGINADGNAVINGLKAQVRKLEQEKEALQDEVQIAKTELEQVNQRREREMRSLLEEASKNQQEVQAKTSQVKQYKKQVDALKNQVAELTKEMDRVLTGMEKLKTGKKPSDTDEPSKLAELEGRCKELSKERDKLYRELDKTKKDLLKAKTKAEAEKKAKKDAEKGNKEAKKKQLEKSATSPKPSEVSRALEGSIAEEEQLFALLLNENDILRDEREQYRKAYNELNSLFKPGTKNLPLAWSHESSLSPLTSPVVDLPRTCDPGQHPPTQLYREDFESERSEREVAHGKIADHQRKYAEDVGELKTQLAQMEEYLCHHQNRLAEVEQVNRRWEREMRSLLEEASKYQQEVQAKTSQVKQYKKQVDALKDQTAEYKKHNEELIQEMNRAMTEMEKLKTGNPKKKPSDTDEPSKLAELEGRNKQLCKERDKFLKELDKTQKDLVKAKAQTEEYLSHYQDRLAEVEQVKTSQVKQYKKQVDSLKDQVAELTKHNEELIQEMDRVRTELVKVKQSGKPKKEPSDTDEPSKLAELEGRNKQLCKERDKLFRELDKTKKDLLKAKTKAEAEKKAKKDAEKGNKEAKKKQLEKSATSLEPSKVSRALEGSIAEEEQLCTQLLNENDLLREELEQYRKAYDELQALFKPGAKNLPLAWSHESSQSPLTSPVIDLPRTCDPGQQPPAESIATEVGDENSHLKIMYQIPFDPNLTCPMCNKQFRIGEIQKYRAHLNKQCTGTQETKTVATEVGDESSHWGTLPYDPNLTCPMCNKKFRFGEIQKYRAHVNKQCVGTQA